MSARIVFDCLCADITNLVIQLDKRNFYLAPCFVCFSIISINKATCRFVFLVVFGFLVFQ